MDEKELAEYIILDSFKRQILNIGYKKAMNIVECIGNSVARLRYRKYLTIAFEQLKKEV